MLWAAADQLEDPKVFVVVIRGARSEGSVLAGRLTQETCASVLLVEAGPDEETATVSDLLRWSQNLRPERTRNLLADDDVGATLRAVERCRETADAFAYPLSESDGRYFVEKVHAPMVLLGVRDDHGPRHPSLL